MCNHAISHDKMQNLFSFYQNIYVKYTNAFPFKVEDLSVPVIAYIWVVFNDMKNNYNMKLFLHNCVLHTSAAQTNYTR